MAHELIEKQVIFQGRKSTLEVHHLRDPETGRRYAREVLAHPGAVVILPFIDEQRIALIQNWRHAAGQILIELPAGTLEPNEAPMNCAGRELLEETGYLAGRLKPLASFYSSPGIMTEKMYIFAAYDLEMRQAKLEDDEQIELLPTPFDEAIDMIKNGEIIDAKTIAAILLYDRFHRGQSDGGGKGA